MATQILKCDKCSGYGLARECSCGGKRLICIPPKYSPEDKYGKYRRMAKEQQA
jgi:H/ACA ribonucleoprotein complex subunit 3